MRRVWIVFLFLASRPAFSQDGCSGAISALTRVKEQITPDLKDVDQLKELKSTLDAASHNCSFDIPEVLYYRKLIAQQLHDQKEVDYLTRKMAHASFKPTYSNPFVAPEAATTTTQELTSKVGRKWALVVGINQFTDASINPLRFAKKDSTDFADYLTDPKGGSFRKDRVKLLINEQATVEGFRSGIGWLRDNVEPSDLVVIYISSHGSPPEGDPNKVSFIVMNDTKPDQLFATSVEMIDLVQMINREIKARRVVLFLDTCFSGDASGPGREVSDGAKRFSVVAANAPSSVAYSAAFTNLKMGVGRAVITASRANEESFENMKAHNGYFTWYLIKELREGGNNKTLGEIFPKVRDEVKAAVSTDHKGKTQTPSSEFNDRAETIVISGPESDAKASTASNE